MSTLTVYANANDGELDAIVDSNYASARAMTGATASTAITTSHVGQGYATDNESYWLYECWETFERFDTSSIPDTDTVSAVVYSSYLYNDASGTDFTDEVRLSTWSVALDSSDAVAGANLGSLTLLASKATLGIGAAGYKDFTSESAFATNINKTGDTVIMRASSRQRLNNAPSGDENCIWYAADQTGTTNDPKLVVTHAAAGGAYTLTAAQATFTETGNAATLKADRKLTAAQATFTMTGVAAGLAHGYTLAAAAASYVLTGNTAGLVAARILAAVVGAFTLTGAATGLLIGRLVAAVVGAFTLTGTATGVLVGRRVTAVVGAFTLTGTATGVLLGRLLSAAAGAFTLTGTAATLTAISGYTLTAVTAAFTVTGQAAGLTAARILGAVTGTFTETGAAAGLLRGYTLAVDAASYTVTGVAAGFALTRRLAATVAAYVLTGNAAGLTSSSVAPVTTTGASSKGPHGLSRGRNMTGSSRQSGGGKRRQH